MTYVDPTNWIGGDILINKRGTLFEFVKTGCTIATCPHTNPVTVLELTRKGDLRYGQAAQCRPAGALRLAPSDEVLGIVARRMSEADYADE